MTTMDASLLIVDDNEMNRDMLSRRLSRKGYQVALAENGYQALELVGGSKFDLILLDIMMPGISGIEVLKTLRQTHSVMDLPIIMVTAKDHSEDIAGALNLGANDYITKPVDFAVALARIQTQLSLKKLSVLKDEFMRVASHDLKNPLTVIIGAAQMVQKFVPPGENMSAEMHSMLGTIGKRAHEIQRIIEDFLDFQALQDGQLRLEVSKISLNELAQDAVEANIDYARRKEIQLDAQLDPVLPEISGDSARLSQVIQNFVSNAIKFGPAGSSATIRTKGENGKVVLEVTDSGPGLTEEDMKKLFRKYARLSNKPTGSEKSSGLGLAICKQMIDMHGGEIGAGNNPGGGATFWFRLPQSQES